MIRYQKPVVSLFASGMIGLGILGLVYGDFAMGWQPVDPWVPGRRILAYASAVLMLVAGTGLLYTPTLKWSIRVLFPYLLAWQLLKVPALFVAPWMEGVWLGFGEIAVLFSGGWVLFALLSQLGSESRLSFLTGQRGVRMARTLFAVSLVPIGLSHLFYVKITVSLIPTWIPLRTGWAYVTGIGQIACGVGILLSIFPSIAATVEAAMLSLFAVLVWLPAVVAEPTMRLPWTAVLITWAIASGAWVFAASMPTKSRSALHAAIHPPV
jgi:uncharacterized membrane protein